jgi:ATP-dependent RNA helicase HelY
MAVNLVEAFGRERAREVLETSFAQFQADRSVVGLARGLREKQETLNGYADAIKCHLGDFMKYASMRREISDLEKEFASSRIRAERGKDIRTSKGRHEKERHLNQLKKNIKHHPCHNCNDREAHARWAERYFKLKRELDASLSQIEGRTNQVARTFDRLCTLLEELEYIETRGEDTVVLDPGKRLARIYGDRDLLISEAIRHGIWNDLDASGLAAMAAAMVYEARRDDEQELRMPKGNFTDFAERTADLWWELEALSKKHKLPTTNGLDFSISYAFHRWASGAKLEQVLDIADLLPGDFIRWAKQVIDALDQIAQNTEGKLSETAKNAIDQVKRGIVAYSFYG